jgi:hypothetical protein
MDRVRASEILDLVAYERVRDAMRSRIIELKTRRRIALGDNLTLLFENRDTVLFQIQEMIRTERIVKVDALQAEVDTYNGLVPDPGELSATLFIEIADLAQMTSDELRQAVLRFQGLDQHCLSLEIGSQASEASFEAGLSHEEKMSAVHFLRFPISAGQRESLARGDAARLLVRHPHYQAEARLPDALRAELLADLR